MINNPIMLLLEEIVNKLSELEGWLKTMESRVSILEYSIQKLDKKMDWLT